MVHKGQSFEHILRPQDLEQLETTSKVKIFLTPAEAVTDKNRSVGALTYGWGSPDHPDVTNDYLHSVRRFLLCPLSMHICAVFWDWDCRRSHARLWKTSSSRKRSPSWGTSTPRPSV